MVTAPAREAWVERLRSGGYRVTTQREQVLEAIDTLRHATPEELLVQVQLSSPSVNLSTIYRTLDVLEAVGLVTHAHIGHGAPTFHAVEEHEHIHLVCGSCGNVESIDADVARPFADELGRRTGFVTEISHVAIHGLCASCASR